MFGFMRGSRFDKTYRQVYAQCCDAQRLRFGVSSLLFHSYESILLYVLAVDAGACPAPPRTAVTCCRLRHRPDNWPGFDTELAKFCSHFALLLAAVKLDDDVRDDGSLPAQFGALAVSTPLCRRARLFPEPGSAVPTADGQRDHAAPEAGA